MNVSYVYNTDGQAEYAVVPIIIWQKISKSIDNELLNDINLKQKQFNPRKFKGLISKLNLDVESEISNLRNEWTRDI